MNWPLDVTGLGSAACGVRLWKGPTSRHLTVIVKATLGLVHEGRAVLLDPEDVVVKDGHYMSSPGRSLEEASEIAPYLAKCDVTLRGHAFAPPGQSVPAMTVRFGIFRGAPILDKKVYLFGDRERQAPEQRTPFARMPLDYEHAHGGRSNKENPVGRGAEKSGAGSALPNVVDPTQAERPAGFAPLSRFWAHRTRELGSAQRGLVDADEPQIPEGFNWRYYQAAPPDQQIPYLAGDEWLVIDGMHPALPRVQTQLPSIRGAGLVYAYADGAYGPAQLVKLEADALAIDADRQVATLIFRGSLVLDPAIETSQLKVFGGLQIDGAPIAWPHPSALAPPAVARPAAHAEPSHDPSGTQSLTPDEIEKAARSKAVPFTDAFAPPPASQARPGPLSVSPDTGTISVSPEELERRKRPAPFPITGGAGPAPSPPADVAPPPSVAEPDFGETRVLRPGDPLPIKKAVPFVAGEKAAPAAVPPPSPPREPAPDFGSTIAVVPGAAKREAVPFAKTPVDEKGAPVSSATPDFGETYQLRPREADKASKTKAHPFAPPPEGAAPALPPSPPREPAPDFGDTLTLSAGGHKRAPRDVSPFPLARSRDAGPKHVPRRESSAVPIVNVTPLTAATTPWQARPPQDALAVLVKGTFDLVPNGRAALREEVDPLSGDLHADDDAERSLVYASDFAVMKPRADVVLLGHAVAPATGPVTHARVSFRFAGGAEPRGFDRAIHVIGDRDWKKAAITLAPGDPLPFERMPLVYERAFGGSGFASNPVGTGHGGTVLPNLEDPSRPITAPTDTPPPACFGPIPAVWKERWSKLGTYDGEWFATRWPYFPSDFDWAHFQAAPKGQQVDYLTGDETYEIGGMHAEHSVLKGTLPGVRVRAFALRTEALGADFFEIPLRLDTAAFDVDTMSVNLVWRGLVEVSDDEAPEIDALYIHTEELGREPVSLDEARRLLLDAAAPNAEELPSEDPGPPSKLDEDTLLGIREAVLARLAAGGGFEGVDFAGAELVDLDFSGRSLEGANFKDATLRGCRFVGSNLGGAVLASADLSDAVLTGAMLAGADLVGAKLERAVLDEADLEGADLSAVDAAGASFRKVRGEAVQFAGATLHEAHFEEANLPFADFTGAKLDRVTFEGAMLREVRFYYAESEGARFDRANLEEGRCDDAKIVKSSFEGVNAPSSVWEKATLTGSIFTSANLSGASFCRARCEGTIFYMIDAPESRFARAKLASASFLKSNLAEADFERADLTGADLRNTNLHGAEVWKAKLGGAQVDLAIVTKSKLKGR